MVLSGGECRRLGWWTAGRRSTRRCGSQGNGDAILCGCGGRDGNHRLGHAPGKPGDRAGSLLGGQFFLDNELDLGLSDVLRDFSDRASLDRHRLFRSRRTSRCGIGPAGAGRHRPQHDDHDVVRRAGGCLSCRRDCHDPLDHQRPRGAWQIARRHDRAESRLKRSNILWPGISSDCEAQARVVPLRFAKSAPNTAPRTIP